MNISAAGATNMTDKPEYGTREYYKRYFSDILTDAPMDDNLATNYEQAMAIMGGFQDAIDEWLQYHETAVQTFHDLRDEFLGFSASTAKPPAWCGDLEAEELALPDIPVFPSLLKSNF